MPHPCPGRRLNLTHRHQAAPWVSLLGMRRYCALHLPTATTYQRVRGMLGCSNSVRGSSRGRLWRRYSDGPRGTVPSAGGVSEPTDACLRLSAPASLRRLTASRSTGMGSSAPPVSSSKVRSRRASVAVGPRTDRGSFPRSRTHLGFGCGADAEHPAPHDGAAPSRHIARFLQARIGQRRAVRFGCRPDRGRHHRAADM